MSSRAVLYPYAIPVFVALFPMPTNTVKVHLKTATGDAGGTALICTSTQTFEIRSMQSSNLIYVAETHRDPEQRSSETGLRAIAQPKGVLELSAKATDALGWVTATLPIFLVEGDADFEGPSDDATRESREAWMDQAPFSAGEFEQGWTAAAAFEHEGVAWRPSATCCVTVWKSMLSAAIIRGVELSQPVSAAQLESAVVEDGLPGSAVDAILQRVSSAGQTKDAAIEEAKLIQWLGEMILRSRGGTKMNKTEFLQQWQGLLPEKWRGAATLEAIKVCHCAVRYKGDALAPVQVRLY